MAQLQQIQFAETIRAMKRAMKRRADDADSDAYISAHTNRGHKLKREAKRVQQDRLGDADALAYRKKIEHAGYTRTIISSNPPFVDDDGDLYSNASSDRDDLEPLEENPFGQIRLERLLRPLTSASELPHHPTLSLPYQTAALTQMAEEAEEMLRRERANLWKAKRVLQRFRGDSDWVPCGVFDSDQGENLLTGEANPEEDMSVVHSLNTDRAGLEAEAETETHTALGTSNAIAERVLERGDEARQNGGRHDETANGVQENGLETAVSLLPDTDGTAADGVNGTTEHMDTSADIDGSTSAIDQDLANSDAASISTPTHAMTTRARARSPTGGNIGDGLSSPSPSDSLSVPPIHPWFIAPPSSFPDRDLALPTMEAEETRRLLLLYVQKQEQIVRSLESLTFGLQKADRLRTFIFRACKAEAHVVPDGKGNMVTEMSDGEDWYDIADWGLASRDLKGGTLEKGKDEVEDPEEESRKVRGRRRVSRM